MMLWAARLLMLALMYLFLLMLIFALLADARAAGVPRRAATPVSARPASPAPTPPASPAQVAAPRCLVASAGTPPTGGAEFPLHGPLRIGRGEENDITIASRFVSTRHARVFSQDGQWLAEDLGSTNGTLLNGTPLTSPRTLESGDHLIVGDTEFTVQ